jgi:hypothetical protein
MNGNKIVLKHACVIAMLTIPFSVLGQDKVDQLTAQGEARTDEGAKAQEAIEKIANQTGDIEAEYRSVTKVVDGLKVYNGLLQKQVDNQRAEMAALTQSIDNVSLIERQIVPLMVRMIDSLDKFVQADVPFLPKERTERIERLRAMMERSDVTAAEKFRRVIEAYQIENDYGRTIEAYKGSLDVDGAALEVDFLRVGRVALLYQSVGAEHTGAWDKASRTWTSLPPEIYRQQVAQGLRIARKQVAPDLLVLPIPAAQEVGL